MGKQKKQIWQEYSEKLILILSDSYTTHWSNIGFKNETIQKCCTLNG